MRLALLYYMNSHYSHHDDYAEPFLVAAVWIRHWIGQMSKGQLANLPFCLLLCLRSARLDYMMQAGAGSTIDCNGGEVGTSCTDLHFGMQKGTA